MSVLLRKPLLFVILLALAGCGGGGGGGGGNAPSAAVPLGGSAVKGPLANALAEVYAIDPAAPDLQTGSPISTGFTGSNAEFLGINLDPAGAPYLLVVTADNDTVDITTQAFPVITTLRTIITADALSTGTPIYATPLTSMAVDVVASQDGTSTDNLQSQLTNAQNQVKTTLGFGLDQSVDIFTTPPLLTDDTDTQAEQEAAAEYRLAIEALSAVVVDIAESTTEGDDTPADVLAALAADLADGELDGSADGQAVNELDGYDVSTLDDVDPSTLTIPGTETSVDDIESVLAADTESTGTTQTLDESIDVSAQPPVLVADTDLDGFGDDVDNCPLNSNDDQSDTNTNGVGDVCDAAPVIAAALSATVDEDSSVLIDLSQGVSDAEGDTLSYSVGEAQLEGASYLYTPAANDNGELSFTFSVSDGTSSTLGTVNVSVTPQNDPGSVSISGDATQGQTLTALVVDAIDGLVNAIISYIWSDESGVIQGETESTLALTQDQVGQAITVSASYTDDEGFQETLQSEATTAVADVNDAPTGQLTLAGTAREDEQVSVVTEGLNDIDGSIVINSYQWNSNGQPIEGANTADYTIPSALVGQTLSVDVVFTDSVFTEVEVTRTATFPNPVANANDVATGNVLISNITPAEGDQLQATRDSFQDEDGLENATFAYQWFADGEEIAGATDDVFSPGQSQVGAVLSVVVSFTDDFGSPESLSSSDTSAVTNVNDEPQGTVSILGSPVVGQTISATNNLTDEDGLGDITYEWFVNGFTTAVMESSYTVQEADVDGDITVVASYEDAFGEQESVASNAVTALAEPVDFDTSLVGSWDLNIEEFGTYDKTIISFTATGEFFFFNVNSDDNDNCRSTGYEYGTYERSGDDINLTRVIDTNGCVGLFDATENQLDATFTITNEETTSITASIFDPIDDPQGNNPDVLTWTKILTNSDSIVGSWHEVFEGQQGNLSNLLIFLGDGRMYAMDADPNNTQENDFFYGDYTYDGAVFNRTWAFQGFPDDASAQNNNTQIVDNRLVFGPEDSLGRNVPDLVNASAPLAFTEAELDAGFTWYFVGPFDDCSSTWVVEEMNFDANGYSLDVCGSGSGEEVNEAYSVLPSGVVNLVQTAEYIKRISFDPEQQAYLVCWADTEAETNDCAPENEGLAFINAADAQDYVDEQLSDFSSLMSGTFSSQVEGDDLPTIFILEADGTGTWSYGENESGNITWSAELDGTLLINFEGGGSEVYTLLSGTLDSGTVNIDFSNEPNANATWDRVTTDADSLVGAWRLDIDPEGQELYNQIYLTLLDTGEFFFIENDTTDQNCRTVGYEYGTYSVQNDRIELDVSFDTNGCIGLVDSTVPETQETLVIASRDSDNALTISFTDEAGEIELTRVVAPVHSVVGLYHERFEESAGNQGANDLSQIILHTGANTFFITDYDRTDPTVNDFSYGTYTYDGESGELEFEFIFATADAENNAGDINTIAVTALAEDSITFGEGVGSSTLRRQGPVSTSAAPNIAVELTLTVTAYQQGDFFSQNGGSSTMQCDSDGGPSINDSERFAEWWQRQGSVMTITNMEFPDDPYTAAFDTQLQAVDYADSEFNADPTGQPGDIFSETFNVTGTATWDETEQAFIGSITEVNELSWSLTEDVSICSTTFDVRAQFQSGDLATFLGQQP